MKLLGRKDDYVGLYLAGIEEWSQFFRKDNWHTFHPAYVEFEGDWTLGGVEASVIVLGLGFRIRLNYAETDRYREIRRNVDKVLEDSTP